MLTIYMYLDVFMRLYLWLQCNYNVHQQKFDTWQKFIIKIFLYLVFKCATCQKEIMQLQLWLTICSHIQLQIEWSHDCRMYILNSLKNLKLVLGLDDH
jgi:hypothetical protein